MMTTITNDSAGDDGDDDVNGRCALIAVRGWRSPSSSGSRNASLSPVAPESPAQFFSPPLARLEARARLFPHGAADRRVRCLSANVCGLSTPIAASIPRQNVPCRYPDNAFASRNL